MRAQFGVLFGGQIQERQSFPNIVDQTKQVQILRIEFRAPRERETTISWEIDRPVSSGRSSGDAKPSVRRIVETGEATVPAGRQRFDQSVPFRPGDPLGRWFIRARVEGRLVLDKGFDVIDAAVADAGPPPR